MIELPVSAQAMQHFERLLNATAQGGELRRIEQEGGSRIYYVKQPLQASQSPRSSEDFLHKILYGKPGPGRSAPVLRLVVNADPGQVRARRHVQSQIPQLLAARPG